MTMGENEKTLDEAIRRSLKDGGLPCPKAFEIAETLHLPIRQVGNACNQLGIKINHCQLGCFD